MAVKLAGGDSRARSIDAIEMGSHLVSKNELIVRKVLSKMLYKMNAFLTGCCSENLWFPE